MESEVVHFFCPVFIIIIVIAFVCFTHMDFLYS